jgi:hypothetical protein
VRGAKAARQGVVLALDIEHERIGIVIPCKDRTDDPHPSQPGDLRDNVLKLNINLPQGLLHVLDVAAAYSIKRSRWRM